MMKMEKQLCDYLIVALQVDPTIDRPGVKNKPVQSVYERHNVLSSSEYYFIPCRCPSLPQSSIRLGYGHTWFLCTSNSQHFRRNPHMAHCLTRV